MKALILIQNLQKREESNEKYDDLRQSLLGKNLESFSSFKQFFTIIKYMPIWNRVVLSWQTMIVITAYILG